MFWRIGKLRVMKGGHSERGRERRVCVCVCEGTEGCLIGVAGVEEVDVARGAVDHLQRQREALRRVSRKTNCGREGRSTRTKSGTWKADEQ